MSEASDPALTTPNNAKPITPLQKAIRYGALSLVVLTVVSTIVWGLIDGSEGFWGALVGAAFGGGFILFTVVVVVLTADASPTTGGAILMGTWLLKLLLAMLALAALRNVESLNHVALGVTALFAMVIVLGCETYAIMTTKIPYVDTADDDNPDEES
ncbi:hypothetical protein [Nocardia sp. 348MFTsu5.1]|uniref:hypothetical protein n=1 Tax=Nocardia sp. 348MFTsu5.1 TaxID=1172185 RepID=UPI000381BAD8|nr:hypothetical protein [Nocardia sp. 348MFTsu5.1]